MGNYTSCCYFEPKTAKLIDVRGNLRHIKLPITAVELMLEDPGHVISPADDLRRTRRFPAMRADEELSAGKVYVLLPAGRVQCKVSESEMTLVDSACQRRRAKRPSSKVQPAEMEGAGRNSEGPDKNSEESDTGLPSYRLGHYRRWRPVLDPIYEGI